MNWLLFLAALIAHESGGKPTVGDKNLWEHTYGVCQIREDYLTDVNTIAGTRFTLEQVHRSESLSRWCVVTYVTHYGKRYTKITGNPLTPEVAARLHNGGPNGPWNPKTDAHWSKVRTKMENIRCQ